MLSLGANIITQQICQMIIGHFLTVAKKTDVGVGPDKQSIVINLDFIIVLAEGLNFCKFEQLATYPST